MEPAGSKKGFFQELPVLPNQFYDDVSFRRALKLFLPHDVAAAVEPDIAQLGIDVLSDQIFAWVTDAERNKPYLRGSGHDAFGRPNSELVVGEGWRKLQDFGIEKGMIATGYDKSFGPYARVVQFLRFHLWVASCANVACPSAMQDGAARLIQLHLATQTLGTGQRTVLENAFRHLISRDPIQGWTSGQWMTERIGGSDVSQSETIAEYAPSQLPALANAEEDIPLGPWSISGFKWFSSATDADMTVLLARTQKGISAFFAPMRRHDSGARTMIGLARGKSGFELNGVRIQRLKNKFGTQSLPTAELELQGMRGWLLGEEGRGIKEISTVLTLTRVHTAISSVSYVGRGLAVAKAYAKVRQVGAGRGRRMLLADSPLHMRTLADITAEYRGLMLLTFFTIHLVGLDEHPDSGRTGISPSLAVLTPEKKHIAPLLRVLTSLCKAYVCKKATPLLYSCMEALGGVGYLVNEETEYLNLARLYRDCCVGSIWEGTTDVLSTDFLRAIKHPQAGQESIAALDAFITSSAGASGEDTTNDWSAAEAWKAAKKRLMENSQDELIGDARQLLWAVAEILIAVLLRVDSESDGSQVSQDIYARFVAAKAGDSAVTTTRATDIKASLERNLAIVYGMNGSEGSGSRPKL